MFSILNRALPSSITSFGNKFCLKMRSRLRKALNNRFYVKFMQLEKGLLSTGSATPSMLEQLPVYFNLITGCIQLDCFHRSVYSQCALCECIWFVLSNVIVNNNCKSTIFVWNLTYYIVTNHFTFVERVLT